MNNNFKIFSKHNKTNGTTIGTKSNSRIINLLLNLIVVKFNSWMQRGKQSISDKTMKTLFFSKKSD